jgi:hypothetical protein
MQKIFVKALLALAIFQVAGAAPAFAQATRTWISGVGDDANPCSRTAPCKTFAGAISKTAAKGEINVLDSGGFGGVTITKSITLRAVGVEAGVLVAGTNGITINAAATDKVVLYGLDIEGLDSTGNSLNGVNVIQAGEVFIEKCNIHGFTGASAGAGVLVNTTTQSRVTILDTTIAHNTNGVVISSTPGFGHVRLLGSHLLVNSNVGVKVTGAGNDVVLFGNEILGSTKGLELISGGIGKSYGNNAIFNPDPTTPLSLN